MKVFHHHHHKPLAALLPDEPEASARLVRRAVTIGCIVNAILMVLKLCTGYLGHSEALTADGFHSLNDMAADLIMLIFVGLSFRKPDGKYTYGYGKFETFSSLLMSAFLIFIAVTVAIEGAESIMAYSHGEVLERPDIWTVIVILIAMASKECLFRFYSRIGKKAGSKALVANAWHHRSDAMASIATLIGVAGAHFLGENFRVLDPIASLLIAIFIFAPAVRMLVPAFGELMEKALPADDMEKARKVISSIGGVDKLVNLRGRRSGHHIIFDATIAVNPSLTIEQGYQITSAIDAALKQAFCPHVLLSVTTQPV